MVNVNYIQLLIVMDNNDDLFEGLSDIQTDKFRDWLPKNMHVYREFIRYARMLNPNRDYKYSARSVYYRMLWDEYISDTTEYRLDVNMTPYISRLCMKSHDDLRGLFRVKN